MQTETIDFDKYPTELQNQLAFSTGNTLRPTSARARILTLFASLEPGASLDFNHILIAIYERWGKVLKRQTVNATCVQATKEGLLQRTRTGVYQITSTGRDWVETHGFPVDDDERTDG